jgi:hypothetical protein
VLAGGVKHAPPSLRGNKQVSHLSQEGFLAHQRGLAPGAGGSPGCVTQEVSRIGVYGFFLIPAYVDTGVAEPSLRYVQPLN